MNERDFLDAIDSLDSDVVDSFVRKDVSLRRRAELCGGKVRLLRIGAMAVCVAILFGAVLSTFLLGGSVENLRVPSPAPSYYGTHYSPPNSFSDMAAVDTFSVTAELSEVLPDTYTRFNDWKQAEYRLLRMEIRKVLDGENMTEEFYWFVPSKYMTDFTLYDCFVLNHMTQAYADFSVLYNKSRGMAEALTLPVFECYGWNVSAFASDGSFDGRLWSSSEAWISVTKDEKIPESLARQEELAYRHADSVERFDGYTGEAEELLSKLRTFENGIFVPSGLSTPMYATRYINGFATNEYVSIYNKISKDGEETQSCRYSKSHFDEEDLNRLPNLKAAFDAVTAALEEGKITPPHIVNTDELNLRGSGVFAWYAKTEDGVLGIVRVSWGYEKESSPWANLVAFDDMYFVVEYGADGCVSVDRDSLLERLGDYETNNIYSGKYDGMGKVYDRNVIAY